MSGSRKLGRPPGSGRIVNKGVRTCVFLEQENIDFIEGVAHANGISVSRALRNMVSWLRDADSIQEPIICGR
jgi:hypothetical protein